MEGNLSSVKILADEAISHPLNEPLLKEAEEIRQERKILKERLAKLDQGRQGVSGAVYQKVHADYLSRLNTTFDRLCSLKKELDEEEKKIGEKKGLVEEAIRSHQEKIEESRLRFELGEFPEDRHRELLDQEEKEILRLEEKRKALEEGRRRHRQVLEGEEFPEISEISETISQKTPKIVIEKVPPPEKVPHLEVMENGKVVQTVPLDKSLSVGRSPSNDIVLKEPKVSRRHARIQCVGGRYVLLDLESSNGTFAGGRKVTEYSLQPDDEITIGSTKMVFKV